MRWVERTLRASRLLVVLLPISAYAPTPALSSIETSFSSESAGAGLIETSGRLRESSFGQRLRLAAQSSPMAARRGSEPDAAESNRSIPSVAVLPQVSLDFNAQPNRSCVDDGDATPYLRVSQLVYDSGRAASDLAAARAHELESRGNQLQPAAATALAVVETRILGLDRRKLLDVIRQNLVIHEEIKRLITGQVSDKFGSNADVMTAQPQTADVQRDYADAQERQTMAEAGFLLSTYATLILTGGVLDLRWITLDKWDGSL